MSRTARLPTTAYIGIGSNLEAPVARIKEAVRLLDEQEHIEVGARSPLYRSAPYGPVNQPDFVNAVVTVRADLDARALLTVLKSIEAAMGRKPDGERWGPRVIDLDLLVYGDVAIDEDDLTIPHPGIAERNFVLLPLRDVAPDLEIPGLGALRELPVSTSEPSIEPLPAEDTDD